LGGQDIIFLFSALPGGGGASISTMSKSMLRASGSVVSCIPLPPFPLAWQLASAVISLDVAQRAACPPACRRLSNEKNSRACIQTHTHTHKYKHTFTHLKHKSRYASRTSHNIGKYRTVYDAPRYIIPQHSIAQHSTAQHIIAWHIAKHSTAADTLLVVFFEC